MYIYIYIFTTLHLFKSQNFRFHSSLSVEKLLDTNSQNFHSSGFPTATTAAAFGVAVLHANAVDFGIRHLCLLRPSRDGYNPLLVGVVGVGGNFYKCNELGK